MKISTYSPKFKRLDSMLILQLNSQEEEKLIALLTLMGPQASGERRVSWMQVGGNMIPLQKI